jgi:hypothetical protein
MPSSALELWNAWRESAEVRETAEGWITRQEGQWTDDDERLYTLFRDAPERGLATIFAIMQLTDSRKIHGSLAAGPLEDFLGVHGEAHLEIIHELALVHRRLREVLDGVWQGSMPKRVWHRMEILKQGASL